MVVERTDTLARRDLPELNVYELRLDGSVPIRVRGRTVWARDRLQAVRFVVMHDVDRITIAEHLDRSASSYSRLH